MAAGRVSEWVILALTGIWHENEPEILCVLGLRRNTAADAG